MGDSDSDVTSVVMAYEREVVRQLMLEPARRDLSVFSQFFTDGRERGVFAFFETDVPTSRVLEVQVLDYDVSVVTHTADEAVVDVRSDERLVWQNPADADPYLLSGEAWHRFMLRPVDGRWLIVDFGGPRDMDRRQGIEWRSDEAEAVGPVRDLVWQMMVERCERMQRAGTLSEDFDLDAFRERPWSTLTPTNAPRPDGDDPPPQSVT